MAPKAVKITDVTGPDKVAASPSSRPLVVTNRPVIADPMVVPTAKSTGDPVASEAVNRTVKVIKPMTLSGDKTEDVPADDTSDKDDSKQAKANISPEEGTGSNPIALDQDSASTDEPEPQVTDSDAEAERAKAQQAEAEVARKQELDDLIASGKYVVPIGAAQRRRSRMYAVALCAVGLLLAVLLFDVILDAGIIKLSKNIPHTHFFTTN